ncbi:helix-turn-helix transcriptional regulator [Streptomyces sp. NPDC052012]|uniref:helix-turn-helix transcriptional regulator n=1 Tax=Streptomyces sp. NPDC052012 TaxID=3155051 RepID=UPI00344E2DED
MHSDQSNRKPSKPNAALTELRMRLSDGLAASGLDKAQLARRAKLGRTTVSEAFQPGGPVPSARTVAVLARHLGLPLEKLLELRRTAVAQEGNPAVEDESRLGRPITQWEPHDLEVHPAGAAEDGCGLGESPQRLLPGYVQRAHDRVLAQAVQDAKAGSSRMLLLVGTSSTGKTRACWEAVQPLADEEWRLWHPFDPTRAEAALEDLERVRPRTVLWLNEAQHYLGDAETGERIAAALHALLTNPDQAPILVLGTLWPEYERQYTVLPKPGQPDAHSRARELLAGRTLLVPDTFDAAALRAASALAKDGDQLLGDALTRASAHGRVTQDLAGAPELMRRYHHGTPAARALLEAAMDARRLGVGLYLPQTFLTDAAIGYLADTDYAELTDDWTEAVIAELAQPVHGKLAPLRHAPARPAHDPPGAPPATPPSSEAGPVFQLADYLEQHGRTTRRWLCPPASFWNAAHLHLINPNYLDELAKAAHDRYRLQWAHHLHHRAAEAGSTRALASLAEMREAAGDPKGAEALAQQAAEAGNPDALLSLAKMRESAGNREGAEALARQLADAGHTTALLSWATTRKWMEDRSFVESLYRPTFDTGGLGDLLRWASLLNLVKEQEGTEVLHSRAVDADAPGARLDLTWLRELARDRERAEALARKLADAGHTTALKDLARMWVREGAADGYRIEVWWPYGLNPDGTPTRPWQ